MPSNIELSVGLAIAGWRHMGRPVPKIWLDLYKVLKRKNAGK